MQLMFWYIARNENGKTGMVPSNFLKPLDEGRLYARMGFSSRIILGSALIVKVFLM